MVEKIRKITKDFLGWAKLKATLQKSDTLPFFYEREIWWIAIGHNVGFEQDGKGNKYARPVLVARKFNEFLFWGIPLTSTKKNGVYYYNFRYKSKQTSTAILSQLRAFDSKRLLDKDGVMNEEDFGNIQKQLRNIIVKRSKK